MLTARTGPKAGRPSRPTSAAARSRPFGVAGARTRQRGRASRTAAAAAAAWVMAGDVGVAKDEDARGTGGTQRRGIGRARAVGEANRRTLALPGQLGGACGQLEGASASARRRRTRRGRRRRCSSDQLPGGEPIGDLASRPHRGSRSRRARSAAWPPACASPRPWSAPRHAGRRATGRCRRGSRSPSACAWRP